MNMMEILPTSKVRKTLRVSAQYLQFPAFSCVDVYETCAFPRQGGGLGKTGSLQHGGTWRGRNCENCREMTACFSTRSGTEGPFSFSETFHCLVIFRYKMEGREFALHRDEDHVSQVHAKCQLVSKRLVKKSLKSTNFFHQFNLSMIKYN